MHFPIPIGAETPELKQSQRKLILTFDIQVSVVMTPDVEAEAELFFFRALFALCIFPVVNSGSSRPKLGDLRKQQQQQQQQQQH